MDKRTLNFVTIIASMCLTLGSSCENIELTSSADYDIDAVVMEDSAKIEDTGNIDDNCGIAFELESDSLEDQIEYVYFHANEWEEEGMNADL